MSFIDLFGALIGRQAERNPLQARRLLRTAYRLTAAKYRYFPSRKFLPSREMMLAAATDCVARSMRQSPNMAAVNIFLPCEILHAMGIEPIFPEAMALYFTAAASEQPFVKAAEKSGVPEGYCSYHKVLLGAAQCGVLPKPAAVLHTTLACDANRLTFARLASHHSIPDFCVDVPNKETPDTIAYVAEQLREMAVFLERITGLRLDETRLRDTVNRSRRTLDNYREYLNLRSIYSLPTDMTGEMLPLYSNHVLLGTEIAEKYTAGMAREIVRSKNRPISKRLLWMHTIPNWQAAFNDLFHKYSDFEIIACDLSFCTIDAMESTQDLSPFEAMAKRLLANSFNGGAGRRIEAGLRFAHMFSVSGVIYFNHWGCKNTAGASQLAKKTLEANGFPTLVLDGDGCDSRNFSDNRQSTRLGAFLEQLEAIG